ncbi:hypothetical protein RKD41_000161 [Streptomyces tendae]
MVPWGADAGVVDQDVEAAQDVRGLGDGCPHARVVGHVRADPDQGVGQAVGLEVEAGDTGAAGGQQACGGQSDAGGTAGDESGQAREVGSAHPSASPLHTGPSG